MSHLYARVAWTPVKYDDKGEPKDPIWLDMGYVAPKNLAATLGGLRHTNVKVVQWSGLELRLRRLGHD